MKMRLSLPIVSSEAICKFVRIFLPILFGGILLLGLLSKEPLKLSGEVAIGSLGLALSALCFIFFPLRKRER